MSTPYLGEIRSFPFNFAPTGWATCSGQLLPISQNIALFSLLGTTYGGDGITTFALPDLQGLVAVSYGNGAGLSPYNLGQAGGEENVTLTSQQMPSHTHAAQCVNAKANKPNPVGNVWAQDAAGTTAEYSSSPPNAVMAAAAISPVGGGQAHDNLQPYLALNYCIALEGIYPSRN